MGLFGLFKKKDKFDLGSDPLGGDFGKDTMGGKDPLANDPGFGADPLSQAPTGFGSPTADPLAGQGGFGAPSDPMGGQGGFGAPPGDPLGSPPGGLGGDPIGGTGKPGYSTFSQPQAPAPGAPHDMDVISAKLDAIRATLDSINQRLTNLERATYSDETPKKRTYGW